MKDQEVSTTLGTTILIIIALTVVAFILLCVKNFPITTDVASIVIQPRLSQETSEQAGDVVKKNDVLQKDAITKNVIFCDTIYKSKKLVINDVDIIDTIAKISEKKTWLCKNLELGKFQDSGIDIAHKKDGDNNSYLIVLFHKNNLTEKNDPFNQSPYIFRFDFKNNQIFYQSQFDGKFNLLGPIY